MKNETKFKSRKIIKLVILISILTIIFLLYRIIIIPKTNNETKILEFLKEKYADNDFEIIEMAWGKQYKTQEIGYDGLVLVPARKVRGKYEYLYKVLSIKDNIKFDLYFLTDNGDDSFQDSYMTFKNINKTNEEISNYIIKTLGHQNARVEAHYDYTTYDSHIDVFVDENVNDVLSEDYVNNLYNDVKVQVDNIIKDFNYLYSSIYNTNSWGHINFEVNIHYKDNNYIHLHPEGVNLMIYNENSGIGQNLKNYLRQISE